jgi:hypothetical protein
LVSIAQFGAASIAAVSMAAFYRLAGDLRSENKQARNRSPAPGLGKEGVSLAAQEFQAVKSSDSKSDNLASGFGFSTRGGTFPARRTATAGVVVVGTRSAADVGVGGLVAFIIRLPSGALGRQE